tara:strand:+ start:1356 stop:1658 length:303 start_codon:yes stop_codon:yes gene_type:complete
MNTTLQIKSNADKFNSYCNVLLGEKALDIKLSIDGVERGVPHTRNGIKRLLDAHILGLEVKASTDYRWFNEFLETPLPHNITPEKVSMYCHDLRLKHTNF